MKFQSDTDDISRTKIIWEPLMLSARSIYLFDVEFLHVIIDDEHTAVLAPVVAAWCADHIGPGTTRYHSEPSCMHGYAIDGDKVSRMLFPIAVFDSVADLLVFKMRWR